MPASPDFDRPLNKRGFSEAEAIAKTLLEQALMPDLMLASTARRTQQTAEIIGAKNRLLPAAHESARSICIWRGPMTSSRWCAPRGPKVQHLAIVGHNPGISELAKLLGPVDIAIVELATAAACTLTFAAAQLDGHRAAGHPRCAVRTTLEAIRGLFT